MKKGLVRIIIGIILRTVQIFALISNFIQEGSILPAPTGGEYINGYPPSFYLGYFSFGIVGIILLAIGLSARKKSNNE